MKKLMAIAALAAASLPLSAQAEVIIGAKAGISKVDVSGFDPAPMVSAQLAYEFLDLAAVDFALELEAGKSASDGEQTIGNAKEDFSVSNYGLFVSARSIGPIYAIGRIGVAKTELNYDNPAVQDIDDSGVAVGAGVGFSLGVRTEVEVTRYEIEQEQAYYVSLGMAF